MKKTLLLLTLFLLNLGVYAQENKGVRWEQGTLQEALNKAKNNKKGPKLVFLDCYTVWCGPCKYMANTIFPTEAAGKYFNENFVNIKIDMEKGEGPELAKRLKLSGYPTFVILAADGEEIGRVVGSNELEPFIESVEVAKDIKNSVNYQKNKFEKSRTSDNAMTYLDALWRNSMTREAGAFMRENLSVFNDWHIFSDKMWKYLRAGISYTQPKIVNFLLENKMKANVTFGTNRVNAALRECFSQTLQDFLQGRKTLLPDEIIVVSNFVNLVMETENTYDQMISNLARWEATGNFKAIAGVFKYGNLRDFSPSEMMQLEEIFAKYDCITKEMFEQYYKSKNSLGAGELKSAATVQEKVMMLKK